MTSIRRLAAQAATVLCALAVVACEPTVRVEAPKEPITINLNIRLDADVRLRLEESAKTDFQANKDVF